MYTPQLGLLPDSLSEERNEKIRKRNLRFGINNDKLKIFDYEESLNIMINASQHLKHRFIPSIFVSWDNSPRRGENGVFIINSTPEKFKNGLKRLAKSISKKFAEERIIFITAWNEWAEGNYLEPDQKYGKQFLEICKTLLNEPEKIILNKNIFEQQIDKLELVLKSKKDDRLLLQRKEDELRKKTNSCEYEIKGAAVPLHKEINRLKKELQFMKSSKFWKLREKYILLKRKLKLEK